MKTQDISIERMGNMLEVSALTDTSLFLWMVKYTWHID